MLLRPLLLNLTLALAACAPQAPAPKAAAPPKVETAAPVAAAPAAPKPDSEKTVLDVALGSPDHTTLVAAVKAAGKADALGSPGGIYTVFAPTNEAFALLPAGTVDSLLTPERNHDLKMIIQHHAAVPIIEQKDMKDGQTIAMSDGTNVTIHITDGKYTVDDANIVAAVRAVNGVVYVVDKVLLPPAK